jgi:hypothetical protein
MANGRGFAPRDVGALLNVFDNYPSVFWAPGKNLHMTAETMTGVAMPIPLRPSLRVLFNLFQRGSQKSGAA